MLKRFANHELGESASRRVGYHSKADYAKSSRAMCHGCDEKIEQNQLRIALMLQDEEGYKSTAWNHFDCFWKHPETRKLEGPHEIYDFRTLKRADQQRIVKAFEELNVRKAAATKQRKNRQETKKKKVKRI
ncbi:unnamed protein product [Adineta ricciae]|uniref:PARP-type domain-containing protein n=1 Tax=Adineta ricciae TaxID=249248 RepID=A0A815D069_ADIRI|nr:unnamed protein product [Adineta ricciae]CAF1290516.1 unnamed protein product [Adineta ricciae]